MELGILYSLNTDGSPSGYAHCISAQCACSLGVIKLPCAAFSPYSKCSRESFFPMKHHPLICFGAHTEQICLTAAAWATIRCCARSGYLQTWLILPVVICLSQRLSHACLSISFYTAKLRMAH